MHICIHNNGNGVCRLWRRTHQKLMILSERVQETELHKDVETLLSLIVGLHCHCFYVTFICLALWDITRLPVSIYWQRESWDYSVSPSPSPFPLDFGFRIWDLDLGLGFGTWIWDLDLGLDLGLTILVYCIKIGRRRNKSEILA